MLDPTHQVRDLAYRLWEEQGRPLDRQLEHWLEAERRLQAPEPAAKPAPARATKPRKRAAAKK